MISLKVTALVVVVATGVFLWYFRRILRAVEGEEVGVPARVVLTSAFGVAVLSLLLALSSLGYASMGDEAAVALARRAQGVPFPARLLRLAMDVPGSSIAFGATNLFVLVLCASASRMVLDWYRLLHGGPRGGRGV